MLSDNWLDFSVEGQVAVISLGPGLCLYALNLGEANSIVLD